MTEPAAEESRNDTTIPDLPVIELMDMGYHAYPRREAVRADCADMRPLEEHLWHLSTVLQDMWPAKGGLAISPDDLSDEWPRISQWLRLAAGLRYVDVDMAYGEPMALCRPAFEYESAASELASRLVTEQTRLHYVWNAVERLLRVMKIPPVPGNRGRFVAAANLLRSAWSSRDLPDHYSHVAEHLRQHCLYDPGLRDNARLQRALEDSASLDESGRLLIVGNQLRHPNAHGDFTVPAPSSWGSDSEAERPATERRLHAPRLAARGLALSIQMLLGGTGAELELGILNTPFDGWWVREGQDWHREFEPSPERLLTDAHLPPPDDDQDEFEPEDQT